MKKNLFVLAVLSFMVSCQKTNEDLINPKDEELRQSSASEGNPNEAWKWLSVTDNTQVSLEEAKREALEMAEQMSEVEETKPTLFASTRHLFSNPISIEEVRIINSGSTPVRGTSGFRRRGEEQADFYLVHYTDNRGYALVSGDKRVPGVLVYNSSGRLDSITNPGQAIMLSVIEDYVERQKELYEKQKDSLREVAIAELVKEAALSVQEHGSGFRKAPSQRDLRSCLRPGEQDAIEERLEIDKHTVTVMKPLLKTLWNQEGDYNKLVEVCSENRRAPVGCVAVAVGQIMAYHKKPNIFKGREMHWEDMTKIKDGDMFSDIESFPVQNNPTAVRDIQHLLARLGDKDLLQMKYNCDASGADHNDAVKTLRLLGYETDGLKDLSEWTLTNDIAHRRPVYVGGCSQRIGPNIFNLFRTRFSGCHAWVLDGYVIHHYTYRRYYRSRCLREPVKGAPFDETKTYVHCNFGWGGEKTGTSEGASGWYKIGVFDASDGYPGRVSPSKETTFRSVPDKEYYYRYQLKMITNIH